MFKFFIFAAILAFSNGAEKLGTYLVDPSSITVSGLSAGGAMAVQFHYAFSRTVRGVGVFAGLPYTCAKGGLMAATQCMSMPLVSPTTAAMIKEAETLASQGKIDSLSNLSGHKAYIFHGTRDTTVVLENGKRIEEMYKNFGVDVVNKFDMAAAHGQPTDHYGAACSSTSGMTQYINNCNYKGAYHMFKHLYGDSIVEPSSMETPGNFFQYDQTEFVTGGAATQCMDSVGFAYVPSKCVDKTIPCRFHIAFHGCSQSKGHVGDAYATKTGYMQAAEANNIIVIFPQATTKLMTNPNACFDWWGYLNANFTSKQGAQMDAIHKMLLRVVKG